MSDAWEREKAELVEKYTDEIAKLTAREKKLQKTIQRHVETEAVRAIAAAGGHGTLLLPHVMKEIRVVEDSDGFRAVVVSKDGYARIRNGSADPMTIEDLVTEFKTRPILGGAFDAIDGGKGAGVGTPSGTAHKISRADAKDNLKYTAAKDAAQRAGATLEIVADSALTDGGGNRGRTHKLSAADAKSHQKYEAAKAAAEEAGATLVIVPADNARGA